MKRHLLNIMAAAILVSTMGLSAQAQSAGSPELIAKVPFEFHVGNLKLPAGEYRVSYINPSSDRRVVRIRNANGRTLVVIQTNNVVGKLNQDARLVFNRYANSYYFSQAWFASDAVGLAARKTKSERDEQLAGKERKIETVSLVRASK